VLEGCLGVSVVRKEGADVEGRKLTALFPAHSREPSTATVTLATELSSSGIN